MPTPAFIRSLLQQATEQGSRSTVLNPLGWMMAILLSATIAAFHYGVPTWIGNLFAIFASIAMSLYLFAYVYFMFKDKDALRSEKYSITKLAIEKGFVGDDKSGVIEVEEAEAVKTLMLGSNDSQEAKK